MKIDRRRARRLFLFAALSGLLVLGLATAFAPSDRGAAPGAPSYDDFQAQLRQGDGKKDDGGEFELFQFDPQQPTAWEWLDDAAGSGGPVDVLIMGPTYVPPDPKGQVPMDWRPLEGFHPTTLGEFVDWIVATYDHVASADDLVIEVLPE